MILRKFLIPGFPHGSSPWLKAHGAGSERATHEVEGRRMLIQD